MLNRIGMRLGVPALLAVTALVAACQVNPVTGDTELIFHSYEQEKQLGDEAVQPIIAQLGGLYPDAALQDYVTRIGSDVEAGARANLKDGKFPDWDFKYYVVNTSMLNAFALPGGHVFVTRGILLRLESEAELAGLLGHECTHVFARHSATRMTEQTLMMIPVALLASFEETQEFAVAGAIAVNLLSMKYSRDHEAESDKFGMRAAAKAGYDPQGIIGVMAMLGEASQGRLPPEFLSTHPDPGHRVNDLTKQFNKEFKDKGGKYVVGNAEFRTGINDLFVTQPAYNLADRGDMAMSEGFQAFEDGDKATAKQKFNGALNLYVQARDKLRSHAILHVNCAQASYYLGQYPEAETHIRDALALEPDTFWPNYMGGIVAIQNNDNVAAQTRLEKALGLVPGSPAALYYLGVSYDRRNQSEPAVRYYREAYNAFGGKGAMAESARERLIALGDPDPAGDQQG